MEKFISKILNKEKIPYTKIQRSNSGFTNIVFFIDDKCVIKIVNQRTKPEKLLKEIAFYQNVKLDFIPKYISSGNIDGVDYLIIEKLKGVSLYKIWHKLSEKERENSIKQIANILDSFHNVGGDFLTPKFINTNSLQKWQHSFELNIKILNEKGFDTTYLEEFSKTKLEKIMTEQRNGLVYNDAHFDNFIYNNGKIYLIDFDRVLYCSIDYELLTIKTMIENPRKFASKEDEEKINLKDYSNIYDQLQKYSKEMFNFKHISERVFIYQFFYNLGEGFELNNNEITERELLKFKNFFKL